MLDIIRKNAGSWIIKVILGAIVVVFIFWGVGSFTSSRMDVVATVNGKKILLSDYRQTYSNALENYRRMLGGQIPESLLKQLDLKRQVLNSMIRDSLIREEAERMGVVVSDAEVQDAIMHTPAFQENGVFSKEYYRRALRSIRMSAPEYENSIRDRILRQKFRTIITSGLDVPESEIREHYMYSNQQINVAYVMVTSGECLGDVNVTDEELSAWYDRHKDSFLTRPKVRLAYILFSEEDMASGANVTEAEIKTYYENNRDEFVTPEMRRAAHILVRVPQGADEKTVQEKKEQIEKIRKKIIGGEAFTIVAKQVSEDTASAKDGGDLGLVKRGMMVKPFEDALFSMEEGSLSQPVRTRFGWHLIKLREIVPAKEKTPDEARESIRAELLKQKEKQAVWDEANRAYDMIIELGGLDEFARANGLEVRETDLFDSLSPPSVIGSNPVVIKSIMALQKGELSSLFEVPDGVMVAEVIKKETPRVPELSEVRERVARRVRNEKSVEKCEIKAEQLLEAAKHKGLADAAKDFSAEVKETGFFRRTDRTAGDLPAKVKNVAVTLFEDKKYPDSVVKNGFVFYVLEFRAEKPASMENFDQEKQAISNRLLGIKQQMALDGWVEHQREKADIRMEMKL